MIDKNKAWEEYNIEDKSYATANVFFMDGFEAGQKAKQDQVLKILKIEKSDCIKCFRPYTAEMFDKIIAEIEGNNNEHCEEDWKVLPDGKGGDSK